MNEKKYADTDIEDVISIALYDEQQLIQLQAQLAAANARIAELEAQAKAVPASALERWYARTEAPRDRYDGMREDIDAIEQWRIQVGL